MWRPGVRVGGISVLALTLAAGLGGCGTSDPPASATGSGSVKAARPQNPRPDMVAAVSASKTPGAADVRFALAARPAIGQPVDIEIAIIPNIELDRLIARFQASEGLQLVKGAETPAFEKPQVHTPISHTVTVIPTADGIFSITATVATDAPTESVARSFSIPIIAGEGLPELPPSTAATR